MTVKSDAAKIAFEILNEKAEYPSLYCLLEDPKPEYKSVFIRDGGPSGQGEDVGVEEYDGALKNAYSSKGYEKVVEDILLRLAEVLPVLAEGGFVQKPQADEYFEVIFYTNPNGYHDVCAVWGREGDTYLAVADLEPLN